MLLAQRDLTLTAGRDVRMISGRVQSSGDMLISAGRNIISEPFYLESYDDSRPASIGWGFAPEYRAVLPGHTASKVDLTELRAYENVLYAGGDVTLRANRDIDLIGTRITSGGGDVTIHSAQGTITMAAAPGFWMYNYQTKSTKKSWFGLKKTTTTLTYDAYEDVYKRTTLKASDGTVSVVSAGPRVGTYSTIISAGTIIDAKNMRISTLSGSGSTATGGSISLGTYTEVSRTSTKTTSKSSFAGITYRNRAGTSAQTAVFNSGNDLLADDILTIASGNNLTIISGSLKARQINVSAVGSLNILAAINSDRTERTSRNQNLATITTIQSGRDRETASLPTMTSPNPVSFTIGGSTHIAAAPGLSLNASLLDVIGTKQFEVNLQPLQTAAQRTASAKAGAAVSDRYVRAYALPGAAQGAQYGYLDTLLDQHGATYNTIMLRDHTWYDKQVQLTPAFQALLTIAVTTATGGAGLGLTGVQQAVATSLISGGIEGAITGKVDPGDLIQRALLAGVSSYASTAISSNFQLSKVLGLSDTNPYAGTLGAQFKPAAVLDRLGAQIVNLPLSNALAGRPLFEGLDGLGRTFVVSELMGVMQFGVGGLGTEGEPWEGSVAHVVLHGGVGCLAIMALDGNCASGFFAGASQGVLAGSSLSDPEKTALAPFVGAMAGFLWADGDGQGVNFGSTVAVSGLRNNYLTHRQIDDLSARIKACNFDPACTEAAYDDYRALAARNRADMLACTTATCWEYHAARMRDAQSAKSDVYDATIGTGRADLVELSNFVYDQQSQSGFAFLITPGAVDLMSSWGADNCGGRIDSACRQAFLRDSTVNNLLGLLGAGIELAIDLTPGVGDVKGAVECAQNVTLASCLGAVAGLLPLLGDGARIIMRHGGNTVDIVADASGVPRVVEASVTTPARITINRFNGVEFENAVIAALGHVGGVKNTLSETVRLSDGTVVTTIPDMWGRNVGGLLEAKNVIDLSRAPQLRGQVQIALDTGQPLNLVVSPRTVTISNPLLADVRATGGNVFVYDPVTDLLTAWP